MSEAVTAALIAAGASVTGSVLAFIVGIRSLRRSVSSPDGVPLGRYVDTQLRGLEHRLERIEHSLSEVREVLAYQRGRTAASLWAPESQLPTGGGWMSGRRRLNQSPRRCRHPEETLLPSASVRTAERPSFPS